MIDRVLFAGGGTGGHIYMAVALAKEIERREWDTQILFVGTRRGVEEKVLPALGFQLRTINIGGLKGVGLWRAAVSLLQFPGSLLASRRIINEFSPSIVVGLGGYSSGPVMLAGKILGLPSLLIEPNVHPGLANRIVGRWVDRAAVAFQETAQWFGEKACLTGIPVRPEFQTIKTEVSYQGPLRLLIFGGSQGSHPINRLVCEALPFLTRGEVSIVHQTGLPDYFSVKKAHEACRFESEVIDFIQDMPSYFSRSDLILSRSGASTVAEIAAAGRPSLLIPLPHAADDHQRKNARALADQKAARVLEQKETNGRELAELIMQLAADRAGLQRMAEASKKLARPTSRELIVELMKDLAAN